MPGSVTAPASLITRLSSANRLDSNGVSLGYSQQQQFLRLLSRNSNGPGAAGTQPAGRSRRSWESACGARGIFPIETVVTGSKAANVGGKNPPLQSGGVNTPVTLQSTGTMTPTTTDITADELDACTWAAAGRVVLSVSAPAGMMGEAVITV